MRRSWLWAGALLAAGVLLGAALVFSLGPRPPQPVGLVWHVDAGAAAADLDEMSRAVGDVARANPVAVPAGQVVSIEGVQVSGDWAVAGGPVRDTASGALTGAEGLVFLLHRVQGKWQAAYPGSPEFASWLDQVPETLLSAETKEWLR